MDNILTYLAHQKLADVTGLFTLLFGIPAAVIGLIGFFEARRWKRSEFLAAEMKAFFERPTTKVVCKMLDWEEGTVYADDFPDLNSGRIKFNEAEVIKALAIESTEGESPSRLVFEPNEEIIRDQIDSFLQSLELINGYIDSRNRLFRPETLKPYIGYYLEIINSDAKNAKVALALRRFVERYKYEGVPRLVSKVTGSPWRGP